MSGIVSYKGYSARITFDADDGLLVGRIAGIADIVGFHADSAAGIVTAFHEAVDDYIETCGKTGKPPEKAFSGNVPLRVSPGLHARIVLKAELAGKSLNQVGEEALRAFVEA